MAKAIKARNNFPEIRICDRVANHWSWEPADGRGVRAGFEAFEIHHGASPEKYGLDFT
jgi:hypothetical protein